MFLTYEISKLRRFCTVSTVFGTTVVSSIEPTPTFKPPMLRQKQTDRPGMVPEGAEALPKTEAYVASENLLLASVAADHYALLHPHLKPIELEQTTILYEAGEPVDVVYFPTTAIISLVVTL